MRIEPSVRAQETLGGEPAERTGLQVRRLVYDVESDAPLQPGEVLEAWVPAAGVAER